MYAAEPPTMTSRRRISLAHIGSVVTAPGRRSSGSGSLRDRDREARGRGGPREHQRQHAPGIALTLRQTPAQTRAIRGPAPQSRTPRPARCGRRGSHPGDRTLHPHLGDGAHPARVIQRACAQAPELRRVCAQRGRAALVLELLSPAASWSPRRPRLGLPRRGLVPALARPLWLKTRPRLAPTIHCE